MLQFDFVDLLMIVGLIFAVCLLIFVIDHKPPTRRAPIPKPPTHSDIPVKLEEPVVTQSLTDLLKKGFDNLN